MMAASKTRHFLQRKDNQVCAGSQQLEEKATGLLSSTLHPKLVSPETADCNEPRPFHTLAHVTCT